MVLGESSLFHLWLARIPRTPGKYKPPPKARWPRFAKSVVCTIITNAEQPDNAIRTHPGLSSEVSPSRVVMHGYGSISCQCRFRTSSMTLDRVSLRRSGRVISIFCRHNLLKNNVTEHNGDAPYFRLGQWPFDRQVPHTECFPLRGAPRYKARWVSEKK